MDYAQMRKQFADEFTQTEGIRVFFAPGRVNLIGEHTDYNGGYVFPAALTYGTWALVRPRQDGVYRFRSTNFPQKADCLLSDLRYKKEDGWTNYPKGVLKELLELDSELAQRLTGADFLFHGNIPIGTGLSSSASIELATALALARLADSDLPMLELVKLTQRAENRFVGVNCGIMDQFAIGMGKRGHAVMLKCDTLDYNYYPLKIDGYKLVITNTNKPRGLADSKYNERRQECEQGLGYLQAIWPEIRSLGEVSMAQWEQQRDTVPDEIVRRRVEHVISENERVVRAGQALEQGDLELFGQLMKQSHMSLRELYEVTGAELDALFDAAVDAPGCIGTRMTGAGFGGCSVSLVEEKEVSHFQEVVAGQYTAKTGLVPTFYVCDSSDGAKEITEEAEGWLF
ncbi:galactokinase [Brevibacillus fulvus]|uniref:Galactokinase n=1 Tax=Brevibacillus fulvus TaxID=1125967 RepID=A0A938Y1H9_9BACL|nr:galactokinase [Brevibacillus fulvus]MBM7590286.1 galactokinase [Brevibacillus fulvus]